MVRRQCEVLGDTSRYFLERNVRPAFSYRGANDDRVLGLVRAGLGVTVMPDWELVSEAVTVSVT